MADFISRALRRIGRFAEPLLDPDAPERRRREQDTIRRLEQTTAVVTRLSGDVNRLQARIAKIDQAQAGALERAAGVLERQTRRQASLQHRLGRIRHQQEGFELTRARALRHVQQIAGGRQPIVVGPWTGEVGFEVLYWAPFVRWVVEKYDVDPSRLTLVSRGGTASWYPPAGRYHDIFELVSPDEFRVRTGGARKKQRWMRLFDRQIVRRVAAFSIRR